jgi:hypothetical protein
MKIEWRKLELIVLALLEPCLWVGNGRQIGVSSRRFRQQRR